MNKNTKMRLRSYRKNCKKNGFPKFIYKKKKKPFFEGGMELSLTNQNEIFYGNLLIKR